MKIAIQKAELQQVPALVGLFLLVERQHETYWPLRWKLRDDIGDRYTRWISSNLEKSDWLFAVALDGGQVVGGIAAGIMTEIPIYAYDRYAFIHDLAVTPEHRRKGIATQLMQFVGNWAGGSGVNQLRLMAAEPNAAAQRLFSRLGFRCTYHEMVLPITKSSEAHQPAGHSV
jgi:GNAT superfamily N-acetyltransferase